MVCCNNDEQTQNSACSAAMSSSHKRSSPKFVMLMNGYLICGSLALETSQTDF